MEKTVNYNGLFRKVWTLYKKEWCSKNNVPFSKRPQGFISVAEFKETLFKNPEFVRNYLSEMEFAGYLKIIEASELIFSPIQIDWEKDSDKAIQQKMHSNFMRLIKLDSEIQRRDKERGIESMMDSLVGRFLEIPVPGHEREEKFFAWYQITAEYKTNVEVRLCNNIGDDWEIPEWGERKRIPKKMAVEFIFSRLKLIQPDEFDCIKEEVSGRINSLA